MLLLPLAHGRKPVLDTDRPLSAQPVAAHQRRDARRPVWRTRPATQPPIGIVADRGELPHGVR